MAPYTPDPTQTAFISHEQKEAGVWSRSRNASDRRNMDCQIIWKSEPKNQLEGVSNIWW